MSDNTGLVFETFGDPAEVLHLSPCPPAEPGPGEVLLKMAFAPVNPADINLVEGTYGYKPTLPAVCGNEGAGTVEAVGPGVSSVKPGDLVLAPPKTGTWRRRLIAKEDAITSLPSGVDPQLAAMLYVNPPTAWRMLHDFADLKPGDWIIQNASNSAVGRSVIQIARAKGWKTLSLVRRPELVEELKALGGDVVEVEDPGLPKRLKELTGGAPIKLGLNCVGGESATLVARCLATGGHHVTFGAMSKKPLTLSNGLLIFKRITFHGFWVSKWHEAASKDERTAMIGELARLALDSKLTIPVEKTFPLESWKDALAAARTEARGGKILLDLQK